MLNGVVLIDAAGHIHSVNRRAERLFGYADGELAGRNVSLLMPSPHREEHDSYVKRYLATGAGKVVGSGREAVGLRKDGSTFPIYLSISEIWLADRRMFVRRWSAM